MTQYKHRITLIVPESMLDIANQLALIAGESSEDVNTFSSVGWQDVYGNRYAVCSAAVKPIVLSILGKPIIDSGLTADGADFEKAQEAMSNSVVYKENVLANQEKILIAVDVEPLFFISDAGLTEIQNTL